MAGLNSTLLQGQGQTSAEAFLFVSGSFKLMAGFEGV